MDNLFFEQLVQRIEGDQKALNEASELFRGMIDRKVWKQLTRQGEIPTDIRLLEEVFYRNQIFFRQVRLEGNWWTRCSGKLLAFTKEELVQDINFANSVASLCVTKRGAIPALPTLEETLVFVKENY